MFGVGPDVEGDASPLFEALEQREIEDGVGVTGDDVDRAVRLFEDRRGCRREDDLFDALRVGRPRVLDAVSRDRSGEIATEAGRESAG